MRITGLASTDLFTGTEPQPRQVIRVTVAEPGPGPVVVTVSGPGVRTPEPATVTAGPLAIAAGAVTAEVGIELAAPHGPWSRLRVTAIAEGRAGRATLDGEITAAEPGWTMWMVSHFHYDPVWWNTQGQFTESRLLLPDEDGSAAGGADRVRAGPAAPGRGPAGPGLQVRAGRDRLPQAATSTPTREDRADLRALHRRAAGSRSSAAATTSRTPT